MHLLFQALFFIICSGIFPYLNKTAGSGDVFSKVSFLAVSAGNEIGEKYHVSLYGKEGVCAKYVHEEVSQEEKEGSQTARFLGRVDPPILSLKHCFSFGFRVPPYIYEKVAGLKGQELS